MEVCKKFDVVLMNPPYDRSMHLKFLEKTIEIANDVVSVQPITFLQNVFGDLTGKKHVLKYKITDISYEGKLNKVFKGTERATYDIGIIHANSNAKVNTDLLYEFIELKNGVFIDPSLIKSVKSKIVDFCKENNLEDNIKSGAIDDTTDYCLIMAKLVGNPGQKTDKIFYDKSERWGRIFYKGKSEGKTVSEYKKKLSNVKNYTDFDYLEFKTLNEAENWIKTQNTDFMRFVTLLNSVDANRRCKFVPFMKSYENSWTDEQLYKYFNITTEESNKIKEYIEIFDNK